MAMTEAQERETMIREGVAALCGEFPGEYWRELDREQALCFGAPVAHCNQFGGQCLAGQAAATHCGLAVDDRCVEAALAQFSGKCLCFRFNFG